MGEPRGQALVKAKILKNEQVASHTHKIKLLTAEIAKYAKPGQFVMVRTDGGGAPLLRRPLSIHSAQGRAQIEILYEAIGRGTEILSRKKPGEHLDIIGPLGSGFDYPAPGPRLPAPILIAGGIGAAPLLFLAERLKRQKPVVLLGAKTKSQILCEKEFKALGCDVRIATDDGSRGFRGFVTGLLRPFGPQNDIGAAIYACGPHSMLQKIAKIAAQRNIPAQVSLEEHMACGIGACLGCVVKTKDGYKRVCKEGPVFNASQVIWDNVK